MRTIASSLQRALAGLRSVLQHHSIVWRRPSRPQQLSQGIAMTSTDQGAQDSRHSVKVCLCACWIVLAIYDISQVKHKLEAVFVNVPVLHSS